MYTQLSVISISYTCSFVFEGSELNLVEMNELSLDNAVHCGAKMSCKALSNKGFLLVMSID